MSRTSASAVSRALRRHAGIRTQPEPGTEGIHVTGPSDHVSVMVSFIGTNLRKQRAESAEAALNMAGYTYERTARDSDQLVQLHITGKRDPNAEIPAEAPTVHVKVVASGSATIMGPDGEQARIGRDSSRRKFTVEDADTGQPIGVANSFAAAGDLYARFLLITGPVRVNVEKD